MSKGWSESCRFVLIERHVARGCVCVRVYVCTSVCVRAHMCMFVFKRDEKELSLSSSCNAAATDCFSLVGHCGVFWGKTGGAY